MKKIHSQEELWPWLDRLGDQQSFYLLEQFVPGVVYHVDSVVSERGIAFAEAHAYGTPPLDTSHQGGVFTTRTLPREAQETTSLLEINRNLIEGLGLVRGVTHAEFLRSHAGGKFYFIEVAAASAAPTSPMSSRPQPASTPGASGRGSKLGQGINLTSFRLGVAITPASLFVSPARSIPTLPHTPIPKSPTASRNITTPASSSSPKATNESSSCSILTPRVFKPISLPLSQSRTNQALNLMLGLADLFLEALNFVSQLGHPSGN